MLPSRYARPLNRKITIFLMMKKEIVLLIYARLTVINPNMRVKITTSTVNLSTFILSEAVSGLGVKPLRKKLKMRTTIEILKVFLDWVGYFFIAYLIGYSTFLFISVIVGSLELYKIHRREIMKNILPQDYHIPISIVVPAYNEEITVVETVKSLLSLEYRAYEIIVVDDGSSDDTSKKLIEAFDMRLVQRPIRGQIECQPEEFVYESHAQKVSLTLIRKGNGGKADSLNMGINAANFPYFICMDADSVLQYDSLQKIAQPVLEYDNVVAVGGMVRISNDAVLENGMVKKTECRTAFLQVCRCWSMTDHFWLQEYCLTNSTAH